ncbi:uncharacterized protein LOC112694373, partial [Sipha flava]
MTGSIKDVSKMNVHVPKRKRPSDVESPSRSKPKKFKSNMSDVSSNLSPSLAYGVHEEPSDEFSCDEDMMSTTESITPIKVIELDASQLNRNEGVLFSEDLIDEYEVWTLQCPHDVDINELHQKSINFNDVKKLNIINSLSNKIDMIPYRSQEDTNITIITPSENTSNLSLNVVPLAGTLIISNRVSKEKPAIQKLIPVDTIEDATRRRSELMSRITQRLSNKYDTQINKDIKIEIQSPKIVKKSK